MHFTTDNHPLSDLHLDVHEQVCALPEAPRSRKGSLYLTPDAKHRAASTARLHSSPAIFPTLPTPVKASSIHGFGPVSEGRGVDRRRAYLNNVHSPLTDDSRGYFAGGCEPELDERQILHQERQLEKQQEKELEKARKAARARERDIEKEIERNQEKERAKEKARIKNIEKQEKIREKLLAKEKEREKDQLRKQQEAGILDSKLVVSGEDRSHVGLGLQFPSESKDIKQGVVRRMRSMSILQKVPNAMDLLPHKRTLQDSTSGRPIERPLQMRSQSISNLSSFSQKSAASSTISNSEANRSPPMLSSLKSSISVQEALAIAPKQSVLSKLAHLNLSQKKLVSQPKFDELPDIPVYKVQENNTDEASTALSPALPLSPTLGESQTQHSPQDNQTPNRRRMTISGIFSKDKSPNSSGSLATLKTLVASRSPPKSNNDTPSRMDGPPSSLGSSGPRITFGILSTDKHDWTSKKGSVGRVQNWLERRLSSNNIANVFIASTDEPVPQMTMDVTLSPPTSVSGNSEIADPSSLADFTSHLKEARTRKRSSLFSSSSSSTPPTPTKSALKYGNSRSPNLPETSTMSGSEESSLITLHPLDPGPPSRTPPNIATWTSEVDTSANQRISSTKSRLQAPAIRRGLSEGLDGESFVDLVILPPLPPESPSEAFVLLDKEAELASKASHDGEDPVAVRDDHRSGSFVQVDHVKSPEILDSDIEAVKEQSQEIFQQIAAFSNEKSEILSDLQLDWESLWPGNASKVESADDAGEFVHVKEGQDNVSNTSKASTPKPERQRIRKTGGTYVKVKEVKETPFTPAIIAPQPKPLVPVQTKVLENSLYATVPEQLQTVPQPPQYNAPPNSMKQRALALPSLLTTNIPRLPSPNSAGSSLSRSWRAISPRSLSPRHSLPVTSHSSSTPASLRSVGADILPDKPGDIREVRNGTKETGPNSRLHPLVHSALAKPVYFDELTPNQRILQRFMQDFQSRIWFTYRKDIARIEPSFYTSDAGWGCMMRTGQSLLAEAFVQIMLGRGKVQRSIEVSKDLPVSLSKAN